MNEDQLNNEQLPAKVKTMLVWMFVAGLVLLIGARIFLGIQATKGDEPTKATSSVSTTTQTVSAMSSRTVKAKAGQETCVSLPTDGSLVTISPSRDIEVEMGDVQYTITPHNGEEYTASSASKVAEQKQKDMSFCTTPEKDTNISIAIR
jgi:hypothetical protein